MLTLFMCDKFDIYCLGVFTGSLVYLHKRSNNDGWTSLLFAFFLSVMRLLNFELSKTL